MPGAQACELYCLNKTCFEGLIKDTVAEAMKNLNMTMVDLANSDASGHEVTEEVRRMLKQFDLDGDGQFSTEEVEAIICNLIQAKKRARDMKYVAFAAFVALLGVCASMLVMTLIGNEISKDQTQGENGRLTVKGTDQVVQVASSDMAVGPDGSLLMRDDGNSDAPHTIRTATHLTQHALSSTVPDKYLAELKSFMYTEPDGETMSVNVESFVRVPEYGAHCGSVVVLQTSLGAISLQPVLRGVALT